MIAASLVVSSLPGVVQAHNDVDVYNDGRGIYERDSISYDTDVLHCDGLWVQTDDPRHFCDDDPDGDRRSDYNSFLFALDGSLAIHARCEIHIRDPDNPGGYSVEMTVAGETQEVCHGSYERNEQSTSIGPGHWTKDLSVAGKAVDQTVELQVSHVRADGTVDPGESINWSLTWVVLASTSDQGTLEDPSGDDYYKSIADDATRYRIVDPSGDDVLDSGENEQKEIETTWDLGEVTATTQETSDGGLIWTFTSDDDSAISVDFYNGTDAWYAPIKDYI